MVARVTVDGLDELIRELKATPDRLDKQVRADFRKIAALVRDKARSKAEGFHPQGGRGGSEQHWRDLVNSIRSGADSDTPTVSIGTDRVKWALGQEFGSKRFRQFPEWTGSSAGAGRFFYPAIRDSLDDAVRASLEAIDRAMRPAFPE